MSSQGAASGVRVNAVAPGFTDTPMVAAVPAELKKGLLARQLIERAIRPEEVKYFHKLQKPKRETLPRLATDKKMPLCWCKTIS